MLSSPDQVSKKCHCCECFDNYCLKPPEMLKIPALLCTVSSSLRTRLGNLSCGGGRVTQVTHQRTKHNQRSAATSRERRFALRGSKKDTQGEAHRGCVVCPLVWCLRPFQNLPNTQTWTTRTFARCCQGRQESPRRHTQESRERRGIGRDPSAGAVAPGACVTS